MPNWCENDLYFKGTPSQIEAVKKAIAGKTKSGDGDTLFDFNQIIPYPKNYAERDDSARAFGYFYRGDDPAIIAARDAHIARYGNDSDGYNSGGYEWCCNKWGTKWNASEAQYRRGRRGPCLTFSTAWSPPLPVIEALSSRYPTMKFVLEWFERGMAQQGRVVYQNGEAIENEEKEYKGERGG